METGGTPTASFRTGCFSDCACDVQGVSAPYCPHLE